MTGFTRDNDTIFDAKREQQKFVQDFFVPIIREQSGLKYEIEHKVKIVLQFRGNYWRCSRDISHIVKQTENSKTKAEQTCSVNRCSLAK